jgi:hypothetical protein
MAMCENCHARDVVKKYYANNNDYVCVTADDPKLFMKCNFPDMQEGQDWTWNGTSIELKKVGIKKHARYFPGTDFSSWKPAIVHLKSVSDDKKSVVAPAESVSDDMKKRLADVIKSSINQKHEVVAKQFMEACITFYSDPKNIDTSFVFVIEDIQVGLAEYIRDKYQITCTVHGKCIKTSVSDMNLK